MGVHLSPIRIGQRVTGHPHSLTASQGVGFGRPPRRLRRSEIASPSSTARVQQSGLGQRRFGMYSRADIVDCGARAVG